MGRPLSLIMILKQLVDMCKIEGDIFRKKKAIIITFANQVTGR